MISPHLGQVLHGNVAHEPALVRGHHMRQYDAEKRAAVGIAQRVCGLVLSRTNLQSQERSFSSSILRLGASKAILLQDQPVAGKAVDPVGFQGNGHIRKREKADFDVRQTGQRGVRRSGARLYADPFAVHLVQGHQRRAGFRVAVVGFCRGSRLRNRIGKRPRQEQQGRFVLRPRVAFSLFLLCHLYRISENQVTTLPSAA